MSEYIERGALLKLMDEAEPLVQGEHDGMGMVAHHAWAYLCGIAKEAPAADVVEVTRCKNCIHAGYINSTLYCYYLSGKVDDDFGCVYGHDKDGGEDNG